MVIHTTLGLLHMIKGFRASNFWLYSVNMQAFSNQRLTNRY
jgi:hypothetical protein